MIVARLLELRALQHPSGGFASTVTSRHGRCLDLNGFVAATVLRLMRHVPGTPELTDIQDRALDWLWACRSTRVPGAFAFWPEAARPPWGRMVPADVDDTAIMLTELLRRGRLDRVAVLRSVCTAIVPCRVGSADVATMPPWVVPGSFFTWIDAAMTDPTSRRHAANIVDCCVNANVAALMSQLEAQHLPGFHAAVETVLSGLDWAGDDERRLRSLTPFYPSPRSLADAIQHAVECGADGLIDGWRRLSRAPQDVLNVHPASCRSAYGGTIWHAPAIDLARALSYATSTW